MLNQCLTALAESRMAPLECIVVDDASHDAPALIPADFDARLVTLPERSGPSIARNRGAELATGEILLFLDADVCVHPGTLERVARSFEQDPELDSVFGSYDDDPGSPDFLSQYRNLMHAFVHQNAQAEASTFWSGCGAIRATVFREMGGFDQSFARPTMEDVELGHRMYNRGCKIILDRDIRVKHLKRWTFWNLVKTDIFGRGIPWTELILRDRRMQDDLNIGLSQRVSVALVFLLVGMSLFAAIWWQGLFLTPMFAVLFIVLGRYWGEFAEQRERRTGLLLTTVIVAIIVIAAWLHDQGVLIPPLLLGYILLLVRHRYEYRLPGISYLIGLTAVVTVSLAAFRLFYIPYHKFVFSVILVFFIVILLNTQFYLFLAQRRGRLFALAAIPFHLLYHFYNGISFIAGTVRFFLRKRLKSRKPSTSNSAAVNPDKQTTSR
jgi:GT2 family glycosyltransferase